MANPVKLSSLYSVWGIPLPLDFFILNRCVHPIISILLEHYFLNFPRIFHLFYEMFNASNYRCTLTGHEEAISNNEETPSAPASHAHFHLSLPQQIWQLNRRVHSM